MMSWCGKMCYGRQWNPCQIVQNKAMWICLCVGVHASACVSEHLRVGVCVFVCAVAFSCSYILCVIMPFPAATASGVWRRSKSWAMHCLWAIQPISWGVASMRILQYHAVSRVSLFWHGLTGITQALPGSASSTAIPLQFFLIRYGSRKHPTHGLATGITT